MPKFIKPKLQRGFTMMELTFVIVILGIVSSIAAEVIAKVYESYVVQRASHRSSIKSELAAMQIVNRLTYAIPNTAIGRVSAADPTFRAVDDLQNGNFSVLQWAGYDADSFGSRTVGDERPGWSGFCDIDASSEDTIVTPGSNPTVTNTIIGNLSDGTRNISDAALFFATTYTPLNIGYNADSTGISNVSSGTSNSIGLDTKTATRNISELYKLAWTSYAIVPLQRTGGLCTDPLAEVGCDLHLRYNFQPWNGTDYNSAGVASSILLRNVTTFRFTGAGNTIRFKLCQRERVSGDFYITTCKEKAVVR